MDDLVQFLRDRLDEDAQAAERADAVDPAPWKAETYAGRPVREQDRQKPSEDLQGEAGMVVDRDGNDLWDCEGSSALSMTSESAAHAARHDPARILAEVDAKRQIVDWHLRQCTCDPCTADGDDMPNTGRVEGGFGDDCPTLRLLALPYADHPDYREEWRP